MTASQNNHLFSGCRRERKLRKVFVVNLPLRHNRNENKHHKCVISAMLVRVLLFVFIALASGASVNAQQSDLPAPTGPVLLTVSGNIARGNSLDNAGRPVARFDRAMLEALGLKTIRTTTLWHEGTPEFEGVSGAALMAAVKGTGVAARAVALNDYVVDLPMDDILGEKFILALKINGKYMTVRERGPIFVIYDYDKTPRGSLIIVQNRSIWQLIRLEVK